MLIVDFHIPNQIYLQMGFGFPNPILAHLGSDFMFLLGYLPLSPLPVYACIQSGAPYLSIQGVFTWLLDHLCWDVIINALQKSVPYYIVPSADIGVCKYEISSSYLEDSSCMSYPVTSW